MIGLKLLIDYQIWSRYSPLNNLRIKILMQKEKTHLEVVKNMNDLLRVTNLLAKYE